MTALDRTLRTHLERSVKDARDLAEAGARAALGRLGVGEATAPEYLTDEERAVRRRLRIHGRQLGDQADESGKTQQLDRLIEEVAYQHWHRMLFARFLAENNVLMYDESFQFSVFSVQQQPQTAPLKTENCTPISLDEAEELAADHGLRNKWDLASRLAARMLPQIFRPDSPVFEFDLPPETQQSLESLIAKLSTEVFTASDSLGWVYQFWQANRKEQINKSEVKIGARELPAVTQLFTEDYMVDFLLDNTLGAWWAGKREVKRFQCSVFSQEVDVRQAVALPGCEWNYLRFIRTPAPPTTETLPTEPLNTEQLNTDYWLPASGTFDGWPKAAKDLKCLDPCMGSGHFVVALFERLVALRMAEEKLDEAAAVVAVIRDNLFGLEIDPRCTQIAAFNLALAAWRRVGYCILPQMNLACSGLAPNTSREEWLALGGDNEQLRNGMERLFDLFEKAPVLGSLINPRADKADLLAAGFHELQPLLEQALSREALTEHGKLNTENYLEMAVTARGLAKAAEILSGQFTLVATNVPYLGRSKQNEVLQAYCEHGYPQAKADLATCFVDRCIRFCTPMASTAIVTPQNWLFSSNYKTLRRQLLDDVSWVLVIRLGSSAFETISGEVVKASLVGLTRVKPSTAHTLLSQDISAALNVSRKSMALGHGQVSIIRQADQRTNPDAVITSECLTAGPLLSYFADPAEGLSTGDKDQYLAKFWEVNPLSEIWEPFQTPPAGQTPYDGFDSIVRWEGGCGALSNSDGARIQGHAAWGKPAVLLGRITTDSASLTCGFKHDKMTVAIVPKDPSHLAAIWSFCSSPNYVSELRKLTQRLDAATGTLVKIPFDLAHWQKVAAEKYPDGLPKPFSSDPTQWLFNGHPHGSDNPLQVAVARLTGYEWPRQTGSSFPDCPALEPDGLETFADKDGIVCIPPVGTELGTADRLLNLLAAAYGGDWNTDVLSGLLSDAGYAGKSLEAWLRDGFFQQHCELFHQRPFIWHIWDGLRDGFSALVNYHKLDQKNLETLIYTYLGDWITRQSQAAASGVDGAQEKLAAAEQLKKRLELILAGEAPHDIFVRWKPLHQQPIGWEPDINDGVRLNIRPFMSVPDVKAKGAGILRVKPKIKWDKDRGKEPQRPQQDFPWFWGWDEKTTDFPGGPECKGERFNDCHYTLARKRQARESQK